jgi:ubiquinone/menaquinone biosynthesis C-methylase UbiE
MSFFWDVMYLFKKTPWDTGITPPEIIAMLESGKVPIGHALDLGCGTGTNAITLAQRGFTVTAIDVSRRAISLAHKTRSAQLTERVQYERGDVTLLRRWVPDGSVDFAYDIGCFHNLKAEARQRYVTALTAVLKLGATYMLYAFEPQVDRAGVALDEIAALFDSAYRLDGMKRGSDRAGRGSAWYTLMKREA